MGFLMYCIRFQRINVYLLKRDVGCQDSEIRVPPRPPCNPRFRQPLRKYNKNTHATRVLCYNEYLKLCTLFIQKFSL